MHQLEEALAAIPKKQAELNQELEEFAGELTNAETRSATLEREQRSKQSELEDSQNAVKQREAKLFQIKTNKEYQAAIHEIAETKRVNKEVEDAVLKLMEEAEPLKTKIAALGPQVEARQKELTEQKQAMAQEAEILKVKLAAAKQVLAEKMQGLDKELLAKYEVARTRNPDAVAYIESGACRGCYLSLRPQLVIEVQRLNDLHACPNCQRLLFIKEVAEAQNP